MSKLLLEGDPKLVAQLDKELMEEFTAQGLADQVTVETQTVQAEVAPGEMGFGEEIRQVLIGVADVLEAGKEAISKLAEGIAKRLARDIYDVEFRKDGTIRIRAGTAGRESDVVELAVETRKILEALRAR